MEKQWKHIKGWGGCPAVRAEVCTPETIVEVQELVKTNNSIVARGSGNSYGDSSLHTTIISTKKLNRIVDEGENWIKVEAGLTLKQLLQHLISRRRFLAVTPGTQAITIGGAIASDVHGKNHYHAGSFFNSTESLLLVNENGDLVPCSRQNNEPLFYSCFGGMGLQGIIVSAIIQTIPLPSHFITEQQSIAETLPEMFQLMDRYKEAPYLVGWIDLLNKNGVGVVKTGAWNLETGGIEPPQTKGITIPFRFPIALPRFLFSWYNQRYLAKARKQPIHTIPFSQFFYPLDAIQNWRYVFGRKGLLQYHFQLPTEVSEAGITDVVQLVMQSKAVCTLAVLKRFGKGNVETPYSFAQEGYNLALDFIYSAAAVQLIHLLDEKVQALGGQIYKSKDALSQLPSAVANGKFQSMQNQRYAQR